MYHTEQGISPILLAQLDKHKAHFTYAKSIVAEFKAKRLTNRHTVYLISNGDLIAYMLYDVLSREQVHRTFKEEGVDLILPPMYQSVLYIDTIDVAEPFQRRGIGSDFVAYITNSKLPILLQSTEDSEYYWMEQGFKLIDYSWMMRG